MGSEKRIRLFVFITVLLIAVGPFALGAELRCLQIGTVTAARTAYDCLVVLYIAITWFGLEDNIVKVYRPHSRTCAFPKSWGPVFWLKIWLLDFMVFQLFVGYLREKYFPGMRWVPAAGEGHYWALGLGLAVVTLLLYVKIKDLVVFLVDVVEAELQMHAQLRQKNSL